jgi:Ser/Thr protein kinase RdoA (MazF antagonist)
MSEPITDIEQLTSEWLTGVLRREGVLGEGRVVSCDVERARTLLISKVFHLSVSYSAGAPDDAPTRLFLKISRPALQSRFSQKEVEFYQVVAPRVPELPLIRCYDAAFSSASGAAHLLLDDVSETHTQSVPPLPPSLRDCELAVDCLAQLHARFWEHPQLGTEIGKLTTEAEFDSLVQTLRAHLEGFMDFLGDRLTDERRKYYERVISGSMQPWRRMLKPEGLTLSHGDAHSWNFLYPRDEATGTALIFDWHLWHVDIPLKDLAFMIAFNWYPQRRALLEEKLLRRYHAALVAGGVARYSWEDCWRDYRFAVIRELCVPVWQWSSGMEPGVWWANLDKIWMAFADLRCAELLDE